MQPRLRGSATRQINGSVDPYLGLIAATIPAMVSSEIATRPRANLSRKRQLMALSIDLRQPGSDRSPAPGVIPLVHPRCRV